MSLLVKRWRHKLSPAARRGREAAREFEAARAYTAWAAKQHALAQAGDGTAAAEKQ